jgi:hypothetical protein
VGVAMRSGLRTLQQAGRRRVRFSATFGCVDRRGYIALADIIGPAGYQVEDHIWIRSGQWHGSIPHSGQRVEFQASIEVYRRESGEEDYGLVGLEVL